MEPGTDFQLAAGTLGTEHPRVMAKTEITDSVNLVFLASRSFSCDVVLLTGWAG